MRLTKGERRILRGLVDETADLVYSRGGGWYFGNSRTSGPLAFSLMRKMLISLEPYGGNETYQVWDINNSGRLALRGETKIYRASDGTMVETIEELMLSSTGRRKKH